MKPDTARAYVGTSGYIYPNWRGAFYPAGLPTRSELEYSSRQFNSIELNSTFYSLKSPAVYQRWYEETPDGFVFAIMGSRFITHNLKLSNVDVALLATRRTRQLRLLRQRRQGVRPARCALARDEAQGQLAPIATQPPS